MSYYDDAVMVILLFENLYAKFALCILTQVSQILQHFDFNSV